MQLLGQENNVQNKITLNTGEIYIGKVLLKNDEMIMISTKDGTRYQFPLSEIKKVENAGNESKFETDNGNQNNHISNNFGGLIELSGGTASAKNSFGWAPNTQLSLMFGNKHLFGQQLFLGIGVSILFLLGCIIPWFKYFNTNRPYAQDQNVIGKVAFFSFLLLILLTLKFGVGGGRLASAYEFLLAIPGIMSIRAVTRMVIVLGLPVAILVSLSCDGLISRFNQNNYFKRLFFTILVATLLSLEVIFFTNVRTPFESWAKRKNDVIALLPLPLQPNSILFINNDGKGPWYLTELDAMVIAQDMGLATVNGYSGQFPAGHHHTTLSSCIPYISRLNAYGKFNSLSEEQTNSFVKNVIEIMPSCFKNFKDADFSLGTTIYSASIPDCKQTLLKGNPIPRVFLKKIEGTDGSYLQGIACHDVSITIDPLVGL